VANEANVQIMMPTAMSFGHLVCFGPKPTSGATDVFTVRKNGAIVATATCTIPTGGTTAVTSAITLSVVAGDLIDVQVVQGNNPGVVWWSLAP
jgi:hypothetical protein